jgi:hypothetical protein
MRALAWITLLLLLAVYCCGVMLANKHLPQSDRAPGTSPQPGAWHEPEGRDAPGRSLLSNCLDALRSGHDSYAAYRNWVFSGIEERLFRRLQEQGSTGNSAGA